MGAPAAARRRSARSSPSVTTALAPSSSRPGAAAGSRTTARAGRPRWRARASTRRETAEVPAFRAMVAPVGRPSRRPRAVNGLTQSMADCSMSTPGGSGRSSASAAASISVQVPPRGMATRCPTVSWLRGPAAITRPAPSIPTGAGRVGVKTWQPVSSKRSAGLIGRASTATTTPASGQGRGLVADSRGIGGVAGGASVEDASHAGGSSRRA